MPFKAQIATITRNCLKVIKTYQTLFANTRKIFEPKMTIQQYIEKINTRFKSGISREHSYRADLENLIRELVKGVEITNEPANVTDCGNPDYVITKGKIPIGYIEAKDIGKDTFSTMHLIPGPFFSMHLIPLPPSPQGEWERHRAPCRYRSTLFAPPAGGGVEGGTPPSISMTRRCPWQ